MRTLSRPHVLRLGDFLLGRGVFLLLFGLYVLTFTGPPELIDSEVEFQTTSAMVREGGLSLGGTPESEAIIANGTVARRVGESTYSWYGVGQALVAVPFYFAGRAAGRVWPKYEERHALDTSHGPPRSEYFAHLFVGLRNPILGALTAMLIVLTARRLRVRRRDAWLAGLAYGLATFAWPQARSTLSDVQATFFLFLGFHLVVALRESYMLRGFPSRRYLAGCGLALGFAFLTRAVTGPAVGVVFAALLAVCLRGRLLRSRGTRWQRRGAALIDFAWAAAPGLACLALSLALNHRRFGDILDFGYEADFLSSIVGGVPPHVGLAGVFLSPGRGLLWLATGVVLVPWGWLQATKTHENLWRWTTVGVVVAILAFVVGSGGWHGAWTYGPRYALPALPFLWVGVALGLARLAARPWGARISRVVLFCGVPATLGGVLVDHVTHQELAMQQARLEWPASPEEDMAPYELGLFVRTHWEWHLAAPWAHWRIFRHRVSGMGEAFPTSQIFFRDGATLTLERPRERGFRHIAWVDFQERLGGRPWPFVLLALLCLGSGVLLSLRGLDRTMA